MSSPSTHNSRLIVTYYPRFRHLAFEELNRAGMNIDAELRLDVDSTLITYPGASNEPAAALKALKPTFVQHISPVHLSIEITGDPADLQELALAALSMSARLDSDTPFAVQCRKGRISVGGRHGEAPYTSKDVEVRVGRALETRGFPVDLLNPVDVVSIYLHGSAAYLGVSATEDNLSVQADEHRLVSAGGKVLVSRAEHKLREALNVFQISLRGVRSVLDLGAAPGGWSRVMADRGVRVTAVDPGRLSDTLAQYSNIEHVPSRIEHVSLGNVQFDMVLNDMNVDAGESAALMCMAAQYGAPGCAGIMTIKLSSRKPLDTIDRTRHILSHAWLVEEMRHLFHNRQEVTVLLRRRDDILPGWERHFVGGRGLAANKHSG